MKKLALAFALSSSLAATPALAQSVPSWLQNGKVPTAAQWQQGFASKQDTLGFSPVNKLGDIMSGPLRFSMPAPTISAGCASVTGNQQAGFITMGSASTSCTLTWPVAYLSTPSCVVTWRTNLASMSYMPSTGGLVVNQTSASGNIIDYHCDGLQ